MLYRTKEFIDVLNAPEREIPAEKGVHVVLDNLHAREATQVVVWLQRHPCWTLHFLPTSASWPNAVEGVFAQLPKRRLNQCVFHPPLDLQAAISRFIKEHNEMEAKPFIWRTNPDEVIAAGNLGFQVLESPHQRRDQPVLNCSKLGVGLVAVG